MKDIEELNLAMEIAQREKRLQSWSKGLSEQNLSSDALKEVKGNLQTYALLLSKLARAENADERRETYGRILAAEREIYRIFDSALYVTERAASGRDDEFYEAEH